MPLMSCWRKTSMRSLTPFVTARPTAIAWILQGLTGHGGSGNVCPGPCYEVGSPPERLQEQGMSPSLEIVIRVGGAAVVFAAMALWEWFAPCRKLSIAR